MPDTFPSSEAIRRRIALLRDPDPAKRQEAIYHLARSVVHIDDVIAAVAIALEDADVDVCREAAVALYMFGAKAKSVLPALIKALRHPDTIVKRAATAAVGLMGPDAAAATTDLRRLENDADELVRVWVQQALTAVSDESKPDRHSAKTTEFVA